MFNMLLEFWSKYGSAILLVLLVLYLLRMYLYFKNKLKMPGMHFYSLVLLAACGPVWIFFWIMHSPRAHLLLFAIYALDLVGFAIIGVTYARKHKLLWNPISDSLWVPALFYKTTALLLVPLIMLLGVCHIWFRDLSHTLPLQITFLLVKGALSGLYLGGAVIYIYQAAFDKYIVDKSKS